MKKHSIIVVGAGSFGTALALTCHRAHHQVTFLVKDASQADEITHHHTNKNYFKNLALPHDIAATTSTAVLKNADAIIVAIPAQLLPESIHALTPFIPKDIPVILTSKGIIDHDPLPLFPYDSVKNILPNPLSLLSGPNFAIELVDNLPAAASLATHNPQLIKLFAHKTFRVYPTTDYTGIEVAGVVKNVLAIGCGIVEERGLGKNAMAALMARGLAEMTRLGLALGARLETFLGPAGVGDLTLTCSSPKSRNFSLGMKLAKGQSIEEILSEGHPLSEGYYSLSPILKLAKAYDIDMPLCTAVSDVIDGAPLEHVIEALFNRPTRVHGF